MFRETAFLLALSETKSGVSTHGSGLLSVSCSKSFLQRGYFLSWLLQCHAVFVESLTIDCIVY